MSQVQERDTQAHWRATSLPFSEVAKGLQDVLGQELTALVAGIGDVKAVGRWASGKQAPQPANERVLRHAYQVVELLLTFNSAPTVRAWMQGMNPHLNDEAPALLLRERPADVLRAARAFQRDVE